MSRPAKKAKISTEPPSSRDYIVIDDPPPKASPVKALPAKPSPAKPARMPKTKIRFPLDNGPEFSGDIMYIIAGVGDNKRDFIILEKAICRSSAFFKKEVDEFKTEGQPVCLELDANPEILYIYLKWIYTGRLFIRDIKLKPETEAPSDSAKPFEHPGDEWTRWKICYELGSNFQDNDFKDTLIDAAIEKLRAEEKTVRDVVQHLPEIIYKNSSEGSRARAFAVDLFLRGCAQADIESVRKESKSSDFIGDLLVAAGKQFLNNDKLQDPLTLAGPDCCIYHEHAQSGKPCYKVRRTYWF